ncbi:MAG: isoleucine--tRNA ligase [archaeon]
MNLKEIDAKVKEHWEKNAIEEKTLKSRAGRQKYYFLDGPPYASGHIHVGTALNKILKDYYLRYYRMNGYDIRAQPGYDCHGVPIEIKVEKELGVKEKSDIEKKIGIEAFIKKCGEFATKYIDVMNGDFDDLGVWMDWKRPYLTLQNEYIEGAWYTFKKAHEKGLLFKGSYPVTICPHCETVVAYNEVVYKELTDTSVYIKFKVKGKKNEYLLVWTTTPWTLPANTGVMAHPEFDYCRAETRNGEVWVFAYELKDAVAQIAQEQFKVTDIFKGKELKDVEYEHPFAELDVAKKVKPRVVLSSEFVTLEKGTGLVHTAPGHGMEDWQVGKETGLDVLCPVGMNGKYDGTVGKYSGRFVKDCDAEIIKELGQKNLLVAIEKVGHDYPTCWRCESPLLFINVPQWFFKVTAIRQKLINENRTVKWSPDWAGKRFHNWLESLDDWPISRQRYWGIPLPIWECNCGEIKVIGSSKELPQKPNDLHRPYIDTVTLKCDKCGKQMKRVPDVLDVWFDSGVCSWASLGYPNETELFKELWPAKLIIEGSDQFRGWWNSQMITSVITFDKKPFEKVIMHGFVLEEHGKSKLCKSKGGIPPSEFTKKYGRDVLRYYYLSIDSSTDFNFDWNAVEEYANKLNVILNAYTFVKTYCKKQKETPLKPEDAWITSRLNSLVKTVDDETRELRHHKAVNAIEDFLINDFSKTYLKMIRTRTKAAYNGEDKAAAMNTCLKVLDTTVRLLAPVAPHLCEYFYLETGGKKASVHLEDWPKADETKINAQLEKEMDAVRSVIERALAARNAAGINVRQPLASLTIDEEGLERWHSLIAEQVNVKKITVGKTLSFDTRIDASLEKEGLTREIIRRVQQMRKELGLVESDRIALSISPKPDINYDELARTANVAEIVDSLEGKTSSAIIKGKNLTITAKKL